MTPEKIAVTVAEAAEMLSLSQRRLREHIIAGNIEARLEGTKWLVSVASLHAYYESLPTEKAS